MSDLETPLAGETTEKNQAIARRVFALQKKSIHDVRLNALSNLATLRRPVLLYTLPTRGNSDSLGEEYRACAEAERYGQDWRLGHYTLGRKQVSIAYLADPAFPNLKMIANFKIGNFLQPEKGERGIFLRLGSVFADERLMEETASERVLYLTRRLAASDVILTRQYGQREHFHLDTHDPEFSESHIGVDLEIRRDVLTLLENVGYLVKVPMRVDETLPPNNTPVYAMMSEDTFRYGEHPDSVKSFGSPARSRDTLKHYLLQMPLSCMQTPSKWCFGCLYLFCDVCKKRKPYVQSHVNDLCRNYHEDNDSRVLKMRLRPTWACLDCQVCGEKIIFYSYFFLFFLSTFSENSLDYELQILAKDILHVWFIQTSNV